MADPKVKISIETTANTKGAKEAESALDDVAKKAKKAKEEVGGIGPGALPAIPPAAKKAADGIKEVAKETSKLGKRNSGAAVLELSRGLEDAQYGIRGILNNLPGLVVALGGTAGLAGALSIAAVAGSVLWEQFGKGSKKSKGEVETLEDRIAGMLKVYQDFMDVGKEARDKAEEAVADKLKAELAGVENDFQIKVGATGVKEAQDAAAAQIQLARDKVDLAETERKLVNATGESAIKLAKDREIIIKRILGDEEAIADVGRQAALSKAEAGVTKAEGGVTATAGADASIAEEYRKQGAVVDALRTEADGLRTTRIRDEAQAAKDVRDFKAEIEAIKKDIRKNPAIQSGLGGGADSRLGKIDAIENQISRRNKFLKDPGTRGKEVELDVQGNVQEGLLKEMGDKLKASADAQDDAAKAMTSATLALKNLKGTQVAEKTGKKGLKEVEKLGGLKKKAADKGEEAGEKIADDMVVIIEGLGEKANDPRVKETIKKVTELTKDGVTLEEEAEVVLLVGSLVKQMKTNYDVSNKAWNDILGNINASISEQGKIAVKIVDINKRIVELQQAVGRAAGK